MKLLDLRRIFLVIGLGLITWNCTYAQDWANLNKYKVANDMIGIADAKQQRVVFMGNSITEGWTNHYPEFFKNTSYINRGISGQTTPQMLLRFRSDVINLRPALVVILAGTNDIAGNTGPTTLEEIANNIFSMVELAAYHDIKVIISSVLPARNYPWSSGCNPDVKIPELNRMLKQYAKKNRITYLDYFEAMVDDNKGLITDLTYDGVHPNTQGYQLMSDMVNRAIKKALKK
ncbi:SGNH/GDSL hydrolase family protein [Carboxylicivirga marina]|uniref:SGNH/GDSL hydrolase family protein n=1 Tax=Carboxylicivirga marina TaxID=2800988 RepID=A0ABS1HN93_9BACT|nr:SGNH/GDSL hydrolase family protein [Carboxylicivirga marina]MBK3519152.1 SGNH/GDSL hydrolase family protein [Carboxylicivirga marina]